MQTTNEKEWTPKEREIAAMIRAAGNDVRCKIRNGKRVFEIVASADGERVTIRTGGAVRVTEARPGLRVLHGVRG
jgi:hypothetical protein